MSEKKNWGKSVLGWFVVPNESDGHPAIAPQSDADSLIAKYAEGPNLPAAFALDGPLPKITNGSVDFIPILDAAGVDADERDRVTKAQELLRSLPTETPAAVKKQIVEASLKAFGFPTEKIIEACVQEIQAFESFIRLGQTETQKALSDGTEKIKQLEQELEALKQHLQDAVVEQQKRTQIANSEKLKVQHVLEFFGIEAVQKVVQESPRIQTP